MYAECRLVYLWRNKWGIRGDITGHTPLISAAGITFYCRSLRHAPTDGAAWEPSIISRGHLRLIRASGVKLICHTWRGILTKWATWRIFASEKCNMPLRHAGKACKKHQMCKFYYMRVLCVCILNYTIIVGNLFYYKTKRKFVTLCTFDGAARRQWSVVEFSMLKTVNNYYIYTCIYWRKYINVSHFKW